MKNIFFLAAVFISISSYAQKINNKISFQKGQKLEVVSQIKIEPEGGMGLNVNGTIIRSFDVEDVNVTSTKIEHKIKRVQFDMNVMGQAQTFDSEKHDDMEGPIGKSLQKSIKNKYSMTLDASGKITNVKADDDNPNTTTSNAEGDMFANVMSQVVDGLNVPEAGEKSMFKILPSNDNINKGFTWIDTTNQAETGKKTYTIKDITDTEIIIGVTGENSTEKVEETMGVQATISTKEQTTGTIVLDKKTGLLKSEQITIQSKGSISASGQSFPLNNTITRNTVVNRL